MVAAAHQLHIKQTVFPCIPIHDGKLFSGVGIFRIYRVIRKNIEMCVWCLLLYIRNRRFIISIRADPAEHLCILCIQIIPATDMDAYRGFLLQPLFCCGHYTDTIHGSIAAVYSAGGGKMTYIENIFLCLAIPMILSLFFIRGRSRSYTLFVTIGMGICLLSAYVNSFFMWLYGVDGTVAAIEITPVCEELLKLLPLLFYFLIWTPH